jgi:hypothetical protein
MSLRFSAAVAGVLIAGSLLAGCADSDSGGDTAAPAPSVAGPSTAGPSMTGSIPSEDPTVPPSGGVTGGPGAKEGDTLTLTGTVTAGVEPNCMLLTANGKEYLLVGGDRTVIVDGAAVVVTGKAAPGVMSTCMQGEPFMVSTARRA